METEIAGIWPGIGDDDRLSSLPDPVISHILSFMETKYAVGTAVLSRRWKDQWTRVSNLDLDCCLAYKPLNREIAFRSLSLDEKLKYQDRIVPQISGSLSEILGRRYLQFSRFVDKVLSQHKNLNSLRRFRFHFRVRYRYWKALSATRFKRELVFGPLVEEIDVMISGKTEFGFPQCLRCIPESFYTLKNLEVAKLWGVILGEINEPVCLPSLKILQLQFVKMKDFESLGRLLSGCPGLESLHLENCCPSNRNEEYIIEASLSFLKNLNISDYADYDNPMCPIVIEAPNLEDLYLGQFAELEFKGSSPLSCLHSARVDLRVECPISYSDLVRLLFQVSNAKKMCLTWVTLNRLSEADDVQLPVFPNLTHLTIEMGGSSWVLHSLLNSASKLQSLIIDKEYRVGEQLKWERLELACMPECLLSSLEEIEIKELVACEDQREMIAYLLKAGIILKKVNMHVSRQYLKLMGHKDLVSLLKLPKGSSACEARLVFPYNLDDGVNIEDETDGEGDRLSSLPDQIISHILSFMETKYAVGTAVLSRRWEHLWTRVSNLDLDNYLVYKSLDVARQLEPVPDILKRRCLQFCHFVDKVLGQHENLYSLRRFRFHFSVEYPNWTVLYETLFDTELVFGPQLEEIDIMILGKTEFGLPQCMRYIPENFYTLMNLKVAELNGVVLGAVDESVCLPNLKILQLLYVMTADCGSISRLISGCPVLETFHLECFVPANSDRDDVIEASLPFLKNLKISDYGNPDDRMCPIVIEAPNLETLNLLLFAELQFKGSRPLSCLNSALVHPGMECRSSYRDLIGLLTAISNAQNISLSGALISRLSYGNHVQFPVFPHLTIGYGGRSLVLHSLLNSAFKLQSIVINMEDHWEEHRMKWERLEPACTPECLLSSLEEIEIGELVAYEDERKMIGYLLRAGVVLKKVNMHVNWGYLQSMGCNDLVSLLKLPRCSGACEVRLVFPDHKNVYRDSDDESDTYEDIYENSGNIEDETRSKGNTSESNNESNPYEDIDEDSGNIGDGNDCKDDTSDSKADSL